MNTKRIFLRHGTIFGASLYWLAGWSAACLSVSLMFLLFLSLCVVFLTFYSIKNKAGESIRQSASSRPDSPAPHRVQHSRCLTAANRGVLILTAVSQGRREKLICINKDGGRQITVGAVGEFFGKGREVTAATQHCLKSVSAELKLNAPCPFFSHSFSSVCTCSVRFTARVRGCWAAADFVIMVTAPVKALVVTRREKKRERSYTEKDVWWWMRWGESLSSLSACGGRPRRRKVRWPDGDTDVQLGVAGKRWIESEKTLQKSSLGALYSISLNNLFSFL